MIERLKHMFKKPEPISEDVKLVLEAIDKWEGEISGYSSASQVQNMCDAVCKYGNATERDIVELAVEAHNFAARKKVAMKRATETAARVLMGDRFGEDLEATVGQSGRTQGQGSMLGTASRASQINQAYANQSGALGMANQQSAINIIKRWASQ